MPAPPDPPNPPKPPEPTDGPRRAVVEAFARALDRSDFAAARELLAPDCSYDRGPETLAGPDPVLQSYAGSAAWAERHFDEVRYESEIVGQAGDRFTIRYTDYLLKAPGRWHRHRCEQDVWVDDRGLVVRIVHRELEREAERLEMFLNAIEAPE
jgi:hypothetical protein